MDTSVEINYIHISILALDMEWSTADSKFNNYALKIMVYRILFEHYILFFKMFGGFLPGTVYGLICAHVSSN